MAKSKKRKQRRNVSRGIAHIKATFNNTIVTITDTNGDTLCYASAGMVGFKGSRKSTPFAAQRAAETCAERATKFGVKEIEVRIKGPGSGRESAVTALQSCGLIVKAIEDVTVGDLVLSAGSEAPEGDGAELVSMWVAPEWRGHGAAAPLIEAVREWAARSRFERLGLWVVEGNLVAEKAYAKAGFGRTGRRQPVREGEPAMEFEMARRP